MTERQRYFVKQKLIGIALIILGIITTLLFYGDCPILLFFGPIGFYSIFTKRMILMDEYYFKIKDSEEEHSVF